MMALITSDASHVAVAACLATLHCWNEERAWQGDDQGPSSDGPSSVTVQLDGAHEMVVEVNLVFDEDGEAAAVTVGGDGVVRTCVIPSHTVCAPRNQSQDTSSHKTPRLGS